MARLRRREKMGLEERPVKKVPIDEAHDHLIFLASKGIGLEAVAFMTGLPKSTIQRVKKRQYENISLRIASKILAIPAIPKLSGHHVDSGLAVKLIHDMMGAGYSKTDIAAMLGLKQARLSISPKMKLSRYERIKTLHAALMKGQR